MSFIGKGLNHLKRKILTDPYDLAVKESYAVMSTYNDIVTRKEREERAKKEFMKQFFHGIPFDVALETLRKHHPEYFV